MAWRYTADPHFCMDRVIDKAKRPFTSIDEMNHRILENILAVQGPDDDLVVVGDFATKEGGDEVARIFDRIPGRKHLVIGNHDLGPVRRLDWASEKEILELEDGHYRYVLCHYPMMTWNQSRHGVIHLFGHVHQSWAGSRNSVNVGVDHWNFSPVTSQEIEERRLQMPVNPAWPIVEPGAEAGVAA